jgi:thiamine-monophosphate kinase|tara:strand:- start:701 stop:1630 length:930 start_codon:yes stop_codon:yes gene_type:complete
MNEFEIIDKYFSKLTKNNRGSFNLKDDIFYDYNKKIAISVDTYVDKIHFMNFKHPNLVIKKCLRSSLSDLICKGVNPKYYFIASAGNSKHFTKINLSKISKALKSEQKKFSIKLSGGDTTYSNTLSFTFVVIGYSTTLPVLRNGAKLNDDIYITNTVGDAFLGLYIIKKNKKILNHKYFVNSFYLPNIPYKFGKKMCLFANAAIDISDGLFQDINHLMENSKFAYDLDLNKIPISVNLAKYLKKNNKKKKSFVSNGDDYQILFTAKKNKSNLIKRIAKKTNTLITKIGVIKKQNIKKTIKNQGYLHKFK